MNKADILFLEDEIALAEIVKESLEAKGFTVRHATTLAKASILYKQCTPVLIIADVMLPDGDGFAWVSQLRKVDMSTPVIFLTSRSRAEDVVTGFELGGNDYLRKPFSMLELVARINALVKKDHQRTIAPASYSLGAYIFYYPSGELVLAGKKKQLTAREADLLYLLFNHRNQSITRQELLKKLWGNTDYFSGRSLDVFITKLRKYLENDNQVKIINVRGIGYKLVINTA